MIGPVRGRASFAAVAGRGRRARAGPITVSWLADPGASGARVAYTVGRRSGGAVQRNRLRRRLRPVMAQLAPHLRPGNYLLGAGSGAVESSPTELASFVAEALARVGALDGPAPLARP